MIFRLRKHPNWERDTGRNGVNTWLRVISPIVAIKIGGCDHTHILCRESISICWRECKRRGICRPRGECYFCGGVFGERFGREWRRFFCRKICIVIRLKRGWGRCALYIWRHQNIRRQIFCREGSGGRILTPCQHA